MVLRGISPANGGLMNMKNMCMVFSLATMGLTSQDSYCMGSAALSFRVNSSSVKASLPSKSVSFFDRLNLNPKEIGASALSSLGSLASRGISFLQTSNGLLCAGVIGVLLKGYRTYRLHCHERMLFLDELISRYCKLIDPVVGIVGKECDSLMHWRVTSFSFAEEFWPEFQDVLRVQETLIGMLIADIVPDASHAFKYHLKIVNQQGTEIQNPVWKDFFVMLLREKEQIKKDRVGLEQHFSGIEKVLVTKCKELNVRPDTPERWGSRMQEIEQHMQNAGLRWQPLQMWWLLIRNYWRLSALEKVVRDYLRTQAQESGQTDAMLLDSPIVLEEVQEKKKKECEI
jgi:hypothetical protein